MGWRLVAESKRQIMRKTVDLGGVFLPFGGLMGAPGVKAGEFGPPCSESVPTIQWMDCLENFGQKNNIFTLAIFVHFHNYRSTKHFLIDFLQYPKIKCRWQIIFKSFSYSTIQTYYTNFETICSSLMLMQEM